jgi:bifunctional DNA-binding transcriptional regulator/antitoxin component of YhaV-PrlF toxin-antitoxin module
MTSARVNSKAEITLPKSVLERLGIEAGESISVDAMNLAITKTGWP